MAASASGPNPPKESRTLQRWTLVIVAVVLVGCAMAAAAWHFTPSVSDLPARVAAAATAHGSPAGLAAGAAGRVGTAIVATEDRRFYQHPGVDLHGAARGVIDAVTGGGDLSGATLDQQLAKVVYTPEDTDVAAKLQQLVLAWKIDHSYDKATILRLYLDAVYFGHGFYGLRQASVGYFGVDSAHLSWAQASVLAGLVQSPSADDPTQHLAAAKQRQRHVLDRLVVAGVLTAADADAAFRAPLHLRR